MSHIATVIVVVCLIQLTNFSTLSMLGFSSEPIFSSNDDALPGWCNRPDTKIISISSRVLPLVSGKNRYTIGIEIRHTQVNRM